jgi:hypothetical protein
VCVRSTGLCTTAEFVFNDCKNLKFGQVCKDRQTDRQRSDCCSVRRGGGVGAVVVS